MSADRTREVLTIVAERLSEFGPAWSADRIEGPLLRGRAPSGCCCGTTTPATTTTSTSI
ncbi:hypothetical protein ACFQZ4_07675 [Catellatospora coxensis]